MSANLDRFANLTRELADVATRIVRDELAVPEERAAEIGMQIAQDVCSEFGGQLIYIPMNALAKIDQRDRDMFSLYLANGRDAVAVAKHFGVCIQTAYRRIKLVESAAYALRQGALFDPAD